MFFSFEYFPLILIGIICLIFAKKIADFMFRSSPDHKFNKQPYKSLLFIWPTRFIGILCLVFYFVFSSGPPTVNLNDKNRISLLENGEIVKAKVQESYFQRLAPEGWKIIYEFISEDPKTHERKTFFGSSQGPKDYYIKLSKGDALDIIYNPQNPNINCEIRCFLNHPSHRYAFKEAGKLNLLDKFSGKYKMENYTFDQWFRLQQQRD